MNIKNNARQLFLHCKSNEHSIYFYIADIFDTNNFIYTYYVEITFMTYIINHIPFHIFHHNFILLFVISFNPV